MKGKGWPNEPTRHSLASHGIETTSKGCKVSKGKVNIDWNKDYLTEKEINLIKNRVNRGDKESLDKFYELLKERDWQPFKLTPEQNQKGYEFLMDKWKTSTGQERKNNPFGYREQKVLENFSHFEISDFYNAGNRYHDHYVPYYTVVAEDGNTFEYAYYGGEIHIMG